MKNVSVLYSRNQKKGLSTKAQLLKDKGCVVDLIEKSGAHFCIRLRGSNGLTEWFTGAELIGKGLLPVEIERYCKAEMRRALGGCYH